MDKASGLLEVGLADLDIGTDSIEEQVIPGPQNCPAHKDDGRLGCVFHVLYFLSYMCVSCSSVPQSRSNDDPNSVSLLS